MSKLSMITQSTGRLADDHARQTYQQVLQQCQIA